MPATDLNSTVTLSQEALAELLAQVKRAQGVRTPETAELSAEASATADKEPRAEGAERTEEDDVG